ncbi:MAG: hypothetical protein EBE86_028425 [Hormoscilla sp. GUM202]|nr:hypothetical protein [Hormoscilla sp. GM7CHS1pb]MBO1351044.1 hypothetical protein [Hormoscilla sp. GUM202]
MTTGIDSIELNSTESSGSAPPREDPPSALLSTFGSWEDTRSPEEIIAEICQSYYLLQSREIQELEA